MTISGEIDIASAPVLREQLLGLLRPPASRIVIDLSGVTFCDANGLAVLVAASRRAGLLDGVLRLAAPAPLTATVLRLTGLDSRFEIFATVPEGPRAPAHPGHPRCGRAGATGRLVSSARDRRAPRDRRRGRSRPCQLSAATGNAARCPVKPMLLWGCAVARLIGDSIRPRPLRLGEKRLGTFGLLPVSGDSSPVECCLPLVLVHLAHP